MATEKVSLTLDEALVAAARANVGSRALSSYVNAALLRQLKRDRILGYLDELDHAHRPVDDEVMEEVRREWPDVAKPKHRRTA